MAAKNEVVIGGQRWRVRFCKLRGAYGECDYDKREIRLSRELAGRDLMDTILHEVFHARWPDIAEESVLEFAASMTAALERYGFRQVRDP
jgi:hypothetical protein